MLTTTHSFFWPLNFANTHTFCFFLWGGSLFSHHPHILTSWACPFVNSQICSHLGYLLFLTHQILSFCAFHLANTHTFSFIGFFLSLTPIHSGALSFAKTHTFCLLVLFILIMPTPSLFLILAKTHAFCRFAQFLLLRPTHSNFTILLSHTHSEFLDSYFG